jgi:hypothetical protein
LLRDRETIEARQLDIEEDDIGSEESDRLDGAGPSVASPTT